jgi:hypothetical protein
MVACINILMPRAVLWFVLVRVVFREVRWLCRSACAQASDREGGGHPTSLACLLSLLQHQHHHTLLAFSDALCCVTGRATATGVWVRWAAAAASSGLCVSHT